MENGKILLIDGSSMLTSNFYGTVPREYYKAKTEEEKEEVYKSLMQTSDGIYTNAVYTTLKMLFYIIRSCNVKYMAIAFDVSRNTFRKELCSDYKGQRKATPDPLRSQFVLMENVLQRLGIPVLMSETYEADDLVGSLAEKLKKNDHVYLWSKDRDYLQLVDDNVTLWMALNDKFAEEKLYSTCNIQKENWMPDKVFPYTPERVKKIYDIYPDQIVDWKAMSGDPSDNIKGIPGISDKTAIPLLKEYGSLDNIYRELTLCEEDPTKEKELADIWKNKLGLKRSPIKYLKEGKESGELSQKLATIKLDIPMNLNKEDLLININMEEFMKIKKELEINDLYWKN